MRATPELLRSLRTQFRSLLPTIVVVAAVSILVLGAVLAFHWWSGVPIERLTRDPAALTRTPVHTGFLSNLGIVLWSAAATLCLFSAARARSKRGDPAWSPFLLASGLLTLLLTLDDLYLLHEHVLPARLGIPEILVFGSYGVATLLYLLRFRAQILVTDYLLLGIAFCFFAASLTLDVLSDVHVSVIPARYFFLAEDGTKFIGITAWLAYFTRVSALALDRSHSEEGPPPRLTPEAS